MVLGLSKTHLFQVEVFLRLQPLPLPLARAFKVTGPARLIYPQIYKTQRHFL